MDVIILPGLDGTGDMLAAFKKNLSIAQNVHVVRYPDNEILGYDGLSQLIFDELPEKKPYCILAESFSGPIATRIAARNPSGLRALIFVASFVSKPSYLPKMFSRLATLAPANSPTLLKLAKPFTFGRWGTKELQALLANSVESVSTKVLAYRIREAMHAEELWRFKGIDFPMLYIQPSQDRLVYRKAANEMRRLNSGLSLVNVEGPHFILQTNPEKCATVVTDFINSVSQE